MYWYCCLFIDNIMQETAAVDGTDEFCEDCAPDLREYYNDCTDGVGVSDVDASKS